MDDFGSGSIDQIRSGLLKKKALSDPKDLLFFSTILSKSPQNQKVLKRPLTQVLHNPQLNPNLPDFHFGVNLKLEEFDQIATRILETGRKYIAMEPEIWDAGTPLERKKMYLKCPTGYLVELKGYKKVSASF